MKLAPHRLSFLAPLVLVLAAGCSSTSENVVNVRPGDSDVLVGNAGLLADLDMVNTRTRTTNDRLEFQVDLVNRTNHDLRFQWRIEWYDRDGFLLDDPRQSAQPAILNGKAVLPVRGISLTPAAVRAKVRIERPNEIKN